MQKLLFVSAMTLAAAALPAQPDHFTSSPAGFESTEGGLSNSVIGQSAALRFQQIDATNFGSKATRNRWGLRRDGLLPDNLQYGARNVEMEFVCAESQLTSASTAFASNYVPGTNTLTFTRKILAFPDWTVAPVTAPASLDLVVFFDTIWSYNGKAVTGTDLLWEVRVYSNSGAGNPYPMDADIVIPSYMTGITSTLGTGCTSPSRTSAMSQGLVLRNHATKFSLNVSLSNGAATAPAAFFLGSTLHIPLPGFCTNLEVLPLITLPMGATSATGAASLMIDPIGYNASYIGGTLAGQTLVVDAGLPNSIGLSEGDSVVVPPNPPTTPQVVHLYALNPSAATATSGIVNGGIIAHTNHP